MTREEVRSVIARFEDPWKLAAQLMDLERKMGTTDFPD